MNNTCEPTDRSINHLTNELLEDLQNPTLGSLELCQLHNLTLPELAAILDSESYQQAVECIARISTARDKLLEHESKSLAKARLTDLLKTYPETEAQRETQRKAATTLLRASPNNDAPVPSYDPQGKGGSTTKPSTPNPRRVPRLDRPRQAVSSEGLQGNFLGPLHSHANKAHNNQPTPNPKETPTNPTHLPTEPRPRRRWRPLRLITAQIAISKPQLKAKINRFRLGTDRFLWIMGETAPHALRTGHRCRFRRERPKNDHQNALRRPDRSDHRLPHPDSPSPIHAN